jgi:hypothetical protein
LELTEKVDVVVSEWSLGAMEKSSDNMGLSENRVYSQL